MYVTDSLGTHTYDLLKASSFAIAESQSATVVTLPLDPGKRYSILLFPSEEKGSVSKTLLGPSDTETVLEVFRALNFALAKGASLVSIRAMIDPGTERKALDKENQEKERDDR